MILPKAADAGRRPKKLAFGIAVAAWPVLSVIVVIIVLILCVGCGSMMDIETWPTTQSLAKTCGNARYCPAYLKIARYYSIVSFSTATFLFLNALAFIFSVQKISQRMSGLGIDSDRTRDLGLTLRTFALLPSFLWLIKIVAIPEEIFHSMYADEYLVFATFLLCAFADASILVVLWRQKDGALWLENREFFGALCYIDIPTLIGIFIIFHYVPLVLGGWEAPETMMKAISGGALVIHVVTSQVILSFLIAEVKFSDFLENHWHKSRLNASRPRRSKKESDSPARPT